MLLKRRLKSCRSKVDWGDLGYGLGGEKGVVWGLGLLFRGFARSRSYVVEADRS